MTKSYNPCDDCGYSASKQNQESGMCKICEFKKAQMASSYMGIAQSKFKAELDAYKKAEEQGLLKMLPCPIGTMVHEPYRFCDDGAWEIDHHYLKLEDLDKIGKTVFVDENDAKVYIAGQEAESALAEKGGV